MSTFQLKGKWWIHGEVCCRQILMGRDTVQCTCWRQYWRTSYHLALHHPLPPSSFPSSFSNNNQSSVSGGASISVPTIPVSASLPSVSAGHGSSTASGGFNELRSSNGSRKARVLYDYDAASSSELSLLADEVSLTQELLSSNYPDREIKPNLRMISVIFLLQDSIIYRIAALGNLILSQMEIDLFLSFPRASCFPVAAQEQFLYSGT